MAACSVDPEVQDPDASPPDDVGAIELHLGAQALASRDFGDVAVGAHSLGLVLTVVNDTADVTGGLDVHVEGSDAGDFDINDVNTDCDGGIILAPRASCAIRIRFRPSRVGRHTARLVVAATPGGTTALDVSGTGFAGPDPAPPDGGVPDGGVPVPDLCGRPAGRTITGDYKVRSSVDLPGLVGVGVITGRLIVDAPGIRKLLLPDLVVVGRDLVVGETSMLIDEVQLPALCSVGGRAAVLSRGALATLDLHGLRRVAGSLEIVGTMVPALALASLESVGGDLRLERNALIAAMGTSTSLRTISGVLRLIDDKAMTSLSGPDGLSALGGLEIKQLPKLANLNGIRLPARLGLLRLDDNDDLVDLSALTPVVAVGDVLAITGNDKLASLAGLGNLITAGTLELRDNAALTDVTAFGRVELLGSLSVVNNDAMTSLVLPGLAAIDRDLTIAHNTTLAELRADLLTAVRDDSGIFSNSKLPVCQAERIRNRVRMNGYDTGFQIEQNALCGVAPGWLKAAGGDTVETVGGIAAFADGSFTIGATFQSTGSTRAIFGPGEFNETAFDIFGIKSAVAKYRADGTLEWATTLASTDRSVIDVAARADGAVVVLTTGQLAILTSPTNPVVRPVAAGSSAVTVAPDKTNFIAGRTTCTQGPCNNGFVLAFDASGQSVWSITMLKNATTAFDAPTGVARLSDGTVMVSGTFRGTATFVGTTFRERTITSAQTIGYVARYSASGALLGVETLSAVVPRVVGGGDFAVVCAMARSADAVLSDGPGAPRTVPAGQLAVVRYGADGRIGWLKTARKRTGAFEAESICNAAASGRGVVVTMNTCGPVVFESGTVDETHAPLNGGACGQQVTARFATDGTFRGASVADSTSPKAPGAMAAMTANAALIYGNSTGTVHTGPLSVPVPMAAPTGLFLTRLDDL